MKITALAAVAGAAALAMAMGATARAGTTAAGSTSQAPAPQSDMAKPNAPQPAMAKPNAPQPAMAKPNAPQPDMAKPNAPSRPAALTHSEVLRVQKALMAHGYAVATDGRWGPKTKAALAAFQKSNGMAATGYPDAATLKALGISP